MDTATPVIQERVRLGDGGRLDGVLSYPADDAPPARAVLLCSPHPNFAGDMENNVIVALAERLAADAVTLRFDYHGIGQSHIDLPAGISLFDYWDEIEQTLDYTAPLADTRQAADALFAMSGGLPMIAVGYSFGAVTGTQTAVRDPRFAAMVGVAAPFTRIGFEHLGSCGKPCLMLSGSDDFVYDPAVAARLARAGGASVVVERVEGADHFFRRQEAMLAARVAQFVEAVTGAAQSQ
jgi:alpha/beta superfamily hydrolase